VAEGSTTIENLVKKKSKKDSNLCLEARKTEVILAKNNRKERTRQERQ